MDDNYCKKKLITWEGNDMTDIYTLYSIYFIKNEATSKRKVTLKLYDYLLRSWQLKVKMEKRRQQAWSGNNHDGNRYWNNSLAIILVGGSEVAKIRKIKWLNTNFKMAWDWFWLAVLVTLQCAVWAVAHMCHTKLNGTSKNLSRTTLTSV